MEYLAIWVAWDQMMEDINMKLNRVLPWNSGIQQEEDSF